MSDDASEDDLFLEAMQDVAPVNKGRRADRRVESETTPGQLQRREAAVGNVQGAVDPNFLTLGEVPPRAPLEVVEWKKNGVQRAVFNKLRKGGYATEATLDLHRKTVREARELLFSFLRLASARDQRALLICPGKGELSPTPGRLKSYTAWWLEQHPEVIAFCSAQRHHGGTGALYVLLRKSQASRELNREQHGQKSDQS